jgi:hypothetical protein
MPPRIYEYRLSDLKDFWKRNDNTHISFSVNEEATLAWYNHLGMRMKNRGPKLTIFLDETEPSAQELPFLCFVRHIIENNRALRPTAQQVVDRIMDLRLLFTTSSTAECEMGNAKSGSMISYLKPKFVRRIFDPWIRMFWFEVFMSVVNQVLPATCIGPATSYLPS